MMVVREAFPISGYFMPGRRTLSGMRPLGTIRGVAIRPHATPTRKVATIKTKFSRSGLMYVCVHVVVEAAVIAALEDKL